MIAKRRNTKALRALVLDADENLAALSRYLHANGIRHRIFEERGRQVVETPTDAEAALIVERHRAWRAGELVLDARPVVQRGARAFAAARRWLDRTPIVLFTTLVALVSYPATWPLEADRLGAVLPWLTATPVHVQGDAIAIAPLHETWARLELWRLVTPAFLHFSLAHLAFDVATLLAFGTRIERRAGSRATLVLLLATAVVSNTAQALWRPDVLFGGLSGVDFGLLGFIVARARREPNEPAWAIPWAFVVLMIAMLVAMSLGITEPFGLSIANAAHWSGLACGALIGLAWPRR